MTTPWPVKRIGDICDVMTGGTPSKGNPEYFEGGKIRWLVSGDIHRKEIVDCEGRITQLGLENSNAKYLPVNSVLIALNGQGRTRGTVAMLRTEATCNQSLVSIYPKNRKEVLPEYVYVNLDGRYEEIRRITGDDGNDRRGLNMALVKSIEIPVAPLGEQKRIVKMLGLAFRGIDKTIENSQKSIAYARELFARIVEEKIFGDPDAKNWRSSTVEELAEPRKGSIRTGPFGSQLLHSEFVDQGIAVLGIDNAVTNEFRWDKKRYITEEKYRKLARYTVKPGDVLITIMGTCGRCAIVPDDIPLAINTKHLCCITLDKEICLPQFLHAYFLWNPIARRYLEARAKGAIMSGLNMGIIKKMPVRYPDVSTQRTIVKKLDELMNGLNMLEWNLERKLNFLAELKRSIFREAFSGELITERTTGRPKEAVA